MLQKSKTKYKKSKICGDSMNLHSLNPYIRYSRKTTAFKASKGDRLCYDCRLFYFLSGSGSITVENETFNITDDCALFLPFGTKYSLDFSKKGVTTYILNFDLFDTYSHIENSLSTPSYDMHDKTKILSYPLPYELEKPRFFTNAGISSNLEKISRLYYFQPSFYREMSSGILKLTLSELIGKSDVNENTLLFTNVKEFIYKNFHDCQLSNSTIASHFGYHPYYLASIIKQTTGKSLHNHISDYRISVSEELLLTTSTDVAQISWMCGFSSVSYFIKTFKDKNGCTPLQYRKMYSI